jgi:isopentenyldiphosphate isomerase
MELIDLVDMNDNIIGFADKEVAHANRQLHRVAVVYVFNEKGELYIQVRKEDDGLYDQSVGGHASHGEDYATSANREADEEIGIRQPLTYLSTFYPGKGIHIFGLFECTASKKWQFVPSEEVDEIIPMKLIDIRKMMIKSPEKFTDGFINTMEEYCKVKKLR